MNSAAKCYTLPPEAPFLRSLAAWLLAEYSKDSGQFTKVLVLLPNRRSCRALREVFLELTNGKPLLLPRIQPIGEVDGEEYFLDGDIDIPQAIDPVRRHFLLTKLVMGFLDNGHIEQAAQLARGLAEFMDDVARAQLDLSTLKKLVPEELANHWQVTLDFLHIISHQWPKLLEAEGVLDPVSHRNAQVNHIAQLWKKTPPEYPVIAAGSTGSQPATARLLKTIASLPQGAVVLPMLDKDMPEKMWEAVADTHPQFGLKQLLSVMEIARKDVQYLSSHTHNTREEILREIFTPPEATADWARFTLPEKALAHVELLEADTQLDEARMIAVALREVLQQPKKTAALITPDRALARMVAASMQRFGIEIDDSAGKPLSNSTPACFLRLCIEMVASRAAPASLLALLRHPLAAAGRDTAECRRLSRELELELLRGIRRESGIIALRDATKSPALKKFLGDIADASNALSDMFQKHRSISLSELLTAHIAFAEFLATTDSEKGDKRLWAGEAGNALATFIAGLRAQSHEMPNMDPLVYGGLFDILITPESYRSNAGQHPRLHILSPIEARLQHFDVVILGGMNEKTWPKAAEADPWMSRPMREQFGLPSHERAIGQSAHDVMMLCFSPQVLITRSRKLEGAPTVPSRWWVRLKTLLGAQTEQMQREEYFAAAKHILETPADIAALEAPAPTPPLSARPRKLRVTAIDQWLKDPYMLYAKYILNLAKLKDIDREPDASDFGNLVHKALEIFTREYPSALPTNAQQKLMDAGRVAFAEFMDRPAVACLWWPRFEAMTQWLLDIENERRALISTCLSEVDGTWEFEVDGKKFTLSTRIDRLEQRNDGSVAIIDYKTGTVPTQSNQLPLEALVATRGALAQKNISLMEYWKLAGEEIKCKITAVAVELEEIEERLRNLIRAYDDEHTAYVATQTSARYNDYEHLTRRKEWEAV